MITTQYRVIYGDTDQMGVVYYGNYLRMFEFGRGAHLRAAGVPYSEVEASGVLLPVAEAHVYYKRPAHYEDLLDIDVALVNKGRASADYVYRIRRGDAVIATGRTRHGCITRDGKKARFPAILKDRLTVDAEDVFETPMENR
ncbi:MAG: thioesterase family protein [Pseudomonadota bacterium]